MFLANFFCFYYSETSMTFASCNIGNKNEIRLIIYFSKIFVIYFKIDVYGALKYVYLGSSLRAILSYS